MESTVYELSATGRCGADIAKSDVPEAVLPEDLLRENNGLPELSQIDVVRHYLRLSQMNFGFLPKVQGSLHLDLTHNGRDPELEAMYLLTNQFHAQQFAYLLKRMKEIDEGGQSLLDSSLLLFCSNLFDGDKHQADRMPFVLAGRAGGSLVTGRVLSCLDRDDDDRRACSLYLSLMDRMDVSLRTFGDSDRRLAGLFVSGLRKNTLRAAAGRPSAGRIGEASWATSCPTWPMASARSPRSSPMAPSRA